MFLIPALLANACRRVFSRESSPRMCVVLALILLLGGVASCTDRQKSMTAYLDRGQALFEQGDIVKAKLEFKNVL